MSCWLGPWDYSDEGTQRRSLGGFLKEGLGDFLSKVYCFLVAKATTLSLWKVSEPEENSLLELPYDPFKNGPFNEPYFPDGRFGRITQILFQEPVANSANSPTFCEDDEITLADNFFVCAARKVSQYQKSGTEALIESRKTLDCQAMVTCCVLRGSFIN